MSHQRKYREGPNECHEHPHKGFISEGQPTPPEFSHGSPEDDNILNNKERLQSTDHSNKKDSNRYTSLSIRVLIRFSIKRGYHSSFEDEDEDDEIGHYYEPLIKRLPQAQRRQQPQKEFTRHKSQRE